MTTEDLARLVQRMRAAQKKYFRTRGQDDLEESKRLEKAVDVACDAVLRQPQLFE